MKSTKPFYYGIYSGIFQGTKVSLSLTLYNTLEKVFNFLNIKKKKKTGISAFCLDTYREKS